MFKVTINKGKIDFDIIEGNALNLMSECCCLVKAISLAIAEDSNKRVSSHEIVMKVAKTLIVAEHGIEELALLANNGNGKN